MRDYRIISADSHIEIAPDRWSHWVGYQPVRSWDPIGHQGKCVAMPKRLSLKDERATTKGRIPVCA